MLLQNVDAEKAVLFEKRQEMAALVHANESQEWVERDGSEGVGGHAIGLRRDFRRALPRGALGGDYSDACGELA